MRWAFALAVVLLLAGCGQTRVAVPHVTDRSLGDALLLLDRAGLRYRVPAEVGVGQCGNALDAHVSQQKPAAAARVPGRGAVALWLEGRGGGGDACRPVWPICSEGYADHAPRFVGLDLAQAFRAARRAKHDLLSTEPLPAVPRGATWLVVQQQPPPGHFVRCSTKFEVVVRAG